MIAEEMVDVLKQRFGEGVVGARLQSAHPCVEVAPDVWHDVAAFMKTDGRLGFDLLRCISSVDQPEDEQLVLVYDLLAFDRGGATGGSSASAGTSGEGAIGGLSASARSSGEGAEALWTKRHEFCVRVSLPRDKPHVASVADIWPTADWHEREAYDMMGIVFDGHPDSVEGPDGPHPRRILCPDDWEGYPLRKDYVFPMEYHGIPAVTEYEQTRPGH